MGAHSCNDGSIVQCQNVTNEADAPISTGGKDAEGFALTHVHSHTLYCLVDHSYHKCLDGQAACCVDGSKPIHNDDNTLLIVLCVGGGCLLVLFLCCCLFHLRYRERKR